MSCGKDGGSGINGGEGGGGNDVSHTAKNVDSQSLGTNVLLVSIVIQFPSIVSLKRLVVNSLAFDKNLHTSPSYFTPIQENCEIFDTTIDFLSLV